MTIPVKDDCVYPVFDSESQICAGETYPSDPKGVCFGDSGGPLMQQNATTGLWHVAGIVSYGYPCRDARAYMRVSYFEQWITDTISSTISSTTTVPTPTTVPTSSPDPLSNIFQLVKLYHLCLITFNQMNLSTSKIFVNGPRFSFELNYSDLRIIFKRKMRILSLIRVRLGLYPLFKYDIIRISLIHAC